MCVLRALPAALQVDSFCFSVSSRALKSRGNSGEGAEPPGSLRPRPPHGATGGGKSPLLALGGHRNSHGGRKGPREIIGTKPQIMGSSPQSLWSMPCVPPWGQQPGEPPAGACSAPSSSPCVPTDGSSRARDGFEVFLLPRAQSSTLGGKRLQGGRPRPLSSSGGCGEGLGLTPLTV